MHIDAIPQGPDDFLSPPPSRAPALPPAVLLRRALRGLPITLVLAGLGAGAGHYAATHVEPRYTSSTVLLIDPAKSGDAVAQSDFAEAYVDASKVASVELMLQSSRLLDEVVSRLRLAEDPRFSRRQPSMLRRLLPARFAGAAGPDPLPPAKRAAANLERMIRTTRIGSTYAIRIDATAPDGALAQRLSGAVADAYLQDVLSVKRDSLRREMQWMTDRVRLQGEEVARSEAHVEDVRRSLGILGAGPVADASQDRQSVTVLQDEVLKADAAVAEAASRAQGSGAGELPAFQSSKVIQTLRQMQAEAARQEADLAARVGDSYPALREARQTRATLDAELAAERGRVAAALNNEYRAAEARRASLAAALAAAMARTSAVSEAEGRVELRQSEGAAEVNRTAYQASLARLRQIEQQQPHITAEARIISGPDEPDAPSFPKPSLFLLAGLVAGGLAGAGASLGLPLARRQVETAAEAEAWLGLPVLGTLPRLRLRGESGLRAIADHVAADPFSEYADAVRLARLRLRAACGARGRVVQITSTVPREGKSTVAASLAVSAAEAGTRTLLVDLDLHRATLSAGLRAHENPGLLDIIAGQATIEDAVRPCHFRAVAVLGAGDARLLRPGLVEGRALPALIAHLADSFDLVILDAPPVLAVTDPLIIARMADATVLVTAWRSTPHRHVETALRALRGAGAPLAGLILNKADDTRALGYRRTGYGYLAGGLPAAPRALTES